MNEENRKILTEEFPKTHYARALEEYLVEELEKMSDITTVVSWDETQGRKHALIILRKVMKFLNLQRPTVAKQENTYV